MSLRTKGLAQNERGFALFTVLIFALILGLAGMSFYAMAFYETRNAIYRENSSEAFYLADGGVERARGEFVENGGWRTEEYDVALGNGTYDLIVRDTTVAGGNNTVYIYAEGHVRNADRAIEIIGDLKPGIPPLLAMRDIDVGGNFCLDGFGHANGEADWGPHDQHFQSGNCDGDGAYTEGFVIKPPYIFTERSMYPTATYYSVVPAQNAGGDWYTEIYITPDSTVHLSRGDSLESVIKGVNVSASGLEIEYEFKHGAIDDYFDLATGIFRKEAGTDYVVINFAGADSIPVTANILFFGQNSSVKSTIINTRFEGANDAQRLDWTRWDGGEVSLANKTTFEPENGIAIISHDMDNATAQTKFGTAAHPALIYLTRDFDRASGQMEINGACIVLRDFVTTGGPDVTYYPELLDLFPEYLQEVQFGTTGVLDIFEWREVAANP